MVRLWVLLPSLSLLVPPLFMGAIHENRITDVTWDPDMRVIHISLESWPRSALYPACAATSPRKYSRPPTRSAPGRGRLCVLDVEPRSDGCAYALR